MWGPRPLRAPISEEPDNEDEPDEDVFWEEEEEEDEEEEENDEDDSESSLLWLLSTFTTELTVLRDDPTPSAVSSADPTAAALKVWCLRLARRLFWRAVSVEVTVPPPAPPLPPPPPLFLMPRAIRAPSAKASVKAALSNSSTHVKT